MAKKMKVMFVPMEFMGHVNSGLGLAHTLRARGHHVVFAIDGSHKDLIAKYGFDVEVIDNYFWRDNGLAELESKPFQQFRLADTKNALWFARQAFNLFSYIQLFFKLLFNYFNKDYKLKRIVDRQKPDLFVIDDVFSYPSLVYADRPWVWLFSANPLGFFRDEHLVPPFLGLPENHRGLDTRVWHMVLRIIEIHMRRFYKVAYYLRGYPANPEGRTLPISPYLNIYGYPRELDYATKQVRPPNTYRIDMFAPPVMDSAPISQPLQRFIANSEGRKLIYVSLGTVLSVDVNYMKNLVTILSDSKHRYIVAKGYNHAQYDLPANMWGDQYVPQRQIIPLVDAVITHGGNNSVAEIFTYGKPMVVLPIWLDAFDNAQRIDELGFGIRLDAQRVDKCSLLGAIDRLLADQSIKDRLTIASKRMLSSDSLERAATLIEDLIKF